MANEWRVVETVWVLDPDRPLKAVRIAQRTAASFQRVGIDVRVVAQYVTVDGQQAGVYAYTVETR